MKFIHISFSKDYLYEKDKFYKDEEHFEIIFTTTFNDQHILDIFRDGFVS